jgi:hypothetical protein
MSAFFQFFGSDNRLLFLVRDGECELAIRAIGVTLAYLGGGRQVQIAAECIVVYWFIGVLRGGRDWHTMRIIITS